MEKQHFLLTTHLVFSQKVCYTKLYAKRGAWHMAKPEQTTRPHRHNRLVSTFIIFTVGLLLAAVIGAFLLLPNGRKDPSGVVIPEWIDPQIIEINGAGRRGKEIDKVVNIAVHYVGNPGTTAMQNRNYFNQPTTTVSSHFLVGLDGEIVQCVPLNEVSSATNHRNIDTVSIEVCHPDTTGKFTDATYASLVRLCNWLCGVYGLKATDVIRHYDVTGKRCPLYYVEHPDAWDALLKDIAAYEEE